MALTGARGNFRAGACDIVIAPHGRFIGLVGVPIIG
jgi:hypothetical protein